MAPACPRSSATARPVRAPTDAQSHRHSRSQQLAVVVKKNGVSPDPHGPTSSPRRPAVADPPHTRGRVVAPGRQNRPRGSKAEAVDGVAVARPATSSPVDRSRLTLTPRSSDDLASAMYSPPGEYSASRLAGRATQPAGYSAKPAGELPTYRTVGGAPLSWWCSSTSPFGLYVARSHGLGGKLETTA